MKKKTPTARPTVLKTLDCEWTFNNSTKAISRTIHFSKYLNAFMFVTRVSINAEVMKIYPEVILKEKSVDITISAPAEALTTKEIALAKRIDAIVLSTTKR